MSQDLEEKASGHKRGTEGAEGDIHLLRLDGEAGVWKKSGLTSDRELGMRC